MLIHPEVVVTPDLPTIKFREPIEQVNLSKELPRILHAQGWGCGTYFHVQFLSHDKSKLLASAKFVVTEETESVQTNDANPYQPVTKTVFNRRCEQIENWWKAESSQSESRNHDIVETGISDESTTPPEVARRRGRPPKNEAA